MPKPELRENGSRRRPPGGWEKFTREIEEHARKRRRAPQQSPAQLANLKPRPLPREGGCTAIATSTGKRCKNAPVRGAQRCTKHGGLLEAPAHPANTRAFLAGYLEPGYQDARRAFYAYDRGTRDTITAAHDDANTGAKRRRRRHWPTLLAGAQALSINDNGLAFRRWLAGLQT